MRTKLRKRGVDIEQKVETVFNLSRMTTAYEDVLKLSSNFEKYSPVYRAVVLAHEAVHYAQRDQYGQHRFNAKYLFSARWRVSVEIPAYREGVRAMVILGVRRKVIEKHIESVPKSLKKYFIGALDFKHVKELTTRTLRKELPGS